MVNMATSEKLKEMDWTKSIEICELVARDHGYVSWLFLFKIYISVNMYYISMLRHLWWLQSKFSCSCAFTCFLTPRLLWGNQIYLFFLSWLDIWIILLPAHVLSSCLAHFILLFMTELVVFAWAGKQKVSSNPLKKG